MKSLLDITDSCQKCPAYVICGQDRVRGDEHCAEFMWALTKLLCMSKELGEELGESHPTCSDSDTKVYSNLFMLR